MNKFTEEKQEPTIANFLEGQSLPYYFGKAIKRLPGKTRNKANVDYRWGE